MKILIKFALIIAALPSNAFADDIEEKLAKSTPSAVIGSIDATLTVSVFFDPTCSMCQYFSIEVLPTLYKEFVETKKLRFHFYDFPLSQFGVGPMLLNGLSCITASLKDESRKDDSIMKYLEASVQARRIGVVNYKALAKSAEVEELKFSQCVEQSLHAERTSVHEALGTKLGVGGVPTFFIGAEKLEGVLPLDGMREILKKHL